jgi:hypothetical protein
LLEHGDRVLILFEASPSSGGDASLYFAALLICDGVFAWNEDGVA